jgi:hypothetical protein
VNYFLSVIDSMNSRLIKISSQNRMMIIMISEPYRQYDLKTNNYCSYCPCKCGRLD